MNRLFVLLISLFALTAHTNAQRPGGGMGGGQRMPAIGKLYGKIVEGSKKTPVEYCTITLMAINKDSVITGGLTRSNGDFMLEKVPMGRFRIRIQFIGYKTVFKQVAVTPNNIEQDLGNISIEPDTKALGEVTIEAEKSNVVMTIDRRIYNVDKDITTRGGNGLDVMKNLPGITVDADGNVTMRNSSPTIFVDGRPTTLTLEQIPADQIDRVEVITNPSAKFDASTTGGIINVVLKKNTKPGYNGVIGAGIGTNKRYNTNLNLNVKENPFNFFISYSLNSRGNLNNGYTNRTNYSNNEITSITKQDNLNEVFNLSQFGRLGVDYNITNRTMLTVAGNFNKMNFEIDDNQDFTFRDKDYIPTTIGERYNRQRNSNLGFGAQLAIKHTFPKQGKEWTTDFNFNQSEQTNNSTFTTTTNYTTIVPKVRTPEPLIQKNTGSGTNRVLTFQFDYTNPITDSSKIEFGFRSNLRLNQSILEVFNNDTNNVYETLNRDQNLSSNYDVDDIVNAAYINYSAYLFAGITYQAGFRVEQTYFVANLLDRNQSFEYKYPNGTSNLINAIFPSLFLSKKFNTKHEMQLNFSRKINRPNFMQIMPFIMFSDRQNYRMGNPALAPEFINIAEANYNYFFGVGNLFTSLFFRHQDNAITNYVYALPSDSSILVSTFINGKNSYNFGMENNLKFSFLNKKLDFTVNYNILYTDISANSGSSGNLQNSGITWNTKGILSYKFPKSITAQINGGYEAPKIIPQGKTLDVYSMDISVSKDFGKALTFSLTLNDVFNTKRWGSVYDTENFYQDFSRRWETRFLRVNFTWRFGEMDVSLFKRKRGNRGDNQGGGMEMEY